MAQLRLRKTLTSVARSFSLLWRRLSNRSFMLASLNSFSSSSQCNQDPGSRSRHRVSSCEGSVCGRRDKSRESVMKDGRQTLQLTPTVACS